MKNKIGWIILILNTLGIYLNAESNEYTPFLLSKKVGNVFNVFFDYHYLYYSYALVIINVIAIWSLFLINKKINKNRTVLNKINFIFGIINSIFLLWTIFLIWLSFNLWFLLLIGVIFFGGNPF